MAKRTYTAEPVAVYRSPEGRVEVWRNGPSDFTAWLDAQPIAWCRSEDEAMHAVAMRLEEELWKVAA